MKISVITAVYNNRETIADAVESVLAQTGADYELVVIDGGSTDGTLEILQDFAERIAVLVSEPDGGIYHALNKGIQRSSGEVIGFLHSDDLFADASVLSHVAAAFTKAEVNAVYGDLHYVRKSNPSQVLRYWRAGEFSSAKLGWGWMPPHPTFYVRRAAYAELGGFDTSYRIAADYELLLRFLSSGMKVAYIPAVLVKMRSGGTSNRSLRNIMRKSLEDLRALRHNRIGGVGALLWKNLSKAGQFLVGDT